MDNIKSDFYCSINGENIVLAYDGIDINDIVNSVDRSEFNIIDLEGVIVNHEFFLREDTYLEVIRYDMDNLNNIVGTYKIYEGLIKSHNKISYGGIGMYSLNCIGLLDILKELYIPVRFGEYNGLLFTMVESVINEEIGKGLNLKGVKNLAGDISINEVSVGENLYDFLIRLSEEYTFIIYIKEDIDGYYLYLDEVVRSISTTSIVDSDIIYNDGNFRVIESTTEGETQFSDVLFDNGYLFGGTRNVVKIIGNDFTKRLFLPEERLPYIENVSNDIKITIKYSPSAPDLVVPSNLIGKLSTDSENEQDFAYFYDDNSDGLFIASNLIVQSGSTKPGVEEYSILLSNGGYLLVDYRYVYQKNDTYGNSIVRSAMQSRSNGFRTKKITVVDDYVFGADNINLKGTRLTVDNEGKISSIGINSFKYLEVGGSVHLTSVLNGIDEIFYVQSRKTKLIESNIAYEYKFYNIVYISEFDKDKRRSSNVLNKKSGTSASSASGGSVVNGRVILDIYENTPELLINGLVYINLNKQS